jgi:hypothetical protein
MGNACTCQDNIDEQEFGEVDILEQHDQKITMNRNC